MMMTMMVMMMMMMLSTVIYVVTLVATVSAGELIQSSCSVEQVGNCTKDLDVLGQKIAPFYDQEELALLCRKWINTKACLDNVVITCQLEMDNGTEARKTFEGIVARKMAEQAAREWIMGYEYLCYDGKMSYSAVEDCFSKSSNITELTEGCYTTYENYTWWLNPDEPLNTHRYCKAARNFFDCLERFAREECGDVFTEWVLEYQEQLWSSHLQGIDCLVGSKITLGEITMLSLCGATTGFCVFFALLSCCFKPENKISEKKTDKKRRSLVHFGETNLSYVKDNREVSVPDTDRQDVITLTKPLEITKM